MKAIVETCDNYRIDRVINCLEKIFDRLGGVSAIIKPGMVVAIKPNLLLPKDPEDAATTHPNVVKGIAAIVQKAGGLAIIAESPGGPYNTTSLGRLYSVTGMEAVADETGAQLNFDLRVEKVENTGGKIVKSPKIIKPLADADLIINAAKLKTHGFMVYSGAVKNMFGAIPGLEKAEYHMRFSHPDRFSDCIIDIFLAAKPRLNIIDGIIAMEGDGPGSGVQKHLGVLIGSEDGFAADYAALELIGVDYRRVPVMKWAEERQLFNPDEVEFEGIDIETAKPASFDVPALEKGIRRKLLAKLGLILGKGFRPKPEILHERCVLCGKCIEVCPPKIISAGDDNRISIDYKKCIRCFCCHEFCPEKAVRIKRNAIRRLFEYKRINNG
jgi:uncharacterized protein (DUF362 family)/Pyruvate/2-oxoacid:ferredoxin oxidoreductase delta subunit